MVDSDKNEEMLLSVALENARSILNARHQADEELAVAKEALEQKTRELDRSLAVLRATLESSTDAILATDGEGKVTTFNNNFALMWGLLPGVIATANHREILDIIGSQFADPQQFIDRMAEINASSPPETYDRLSLVDERILEQFSRIQFVDGQSVGRVWTYRDITERQRTLLALERSEKDLRDFFDNAAVGLHWVGPDGTILRVNQAELDMLGYTREEYLGRNIAEFYEDEAIIADILSSLTDGKELHNYPARLVAKDGSVRQVLINSNVLWEDDKFVHTRCFTRDVTNLERAQHSQDLLASIVEASDDAIISKTLDSIVTSWNAAAERHFGYTAEEAIGRHISFLMPPDRRDEEDLIIARIREGDRVDHFDTIRLRKDGQQINVSLTISPIRDFAGRVVGASKIARDISKRKEMEEELLAYAAEMSDMDRRKNEFLAMLAHELRNPLAPIRNALQIIKMSPGEGASQVTEIMERQVGQLVRLVDDLLDVSRITTGKIELRKEQIDMNGVVSQAVEAARSGCEDSGIELIVSLPTQPVYLVGDPARLTQVVGNLLNNSCKFTNEGGSVNLTLETDGSRVALKVRDTGIGIAPEKLPRIFEMFVQADTSLERSIGGLGIGLALVHNLVEMHGGSVSAHSEGLGHGSEFIINLPVDAPASAKPETDELADEINKERVGKRILVVDDNQDSAESLAVLLELSGHEVRIAHDGIDAVKTSDEFLPNVILLDIGLPRMNGYEAARVIRRRPWGADVTLIALTGWGQKEDRDRSKEAGFDTHLVKPVDHVELLKQLSESDD